MKRVCSSLVLVAIALLPAANAGDMDKDAKAIEGDWSPVSAEMAGMKMPDEFAKSIQLNVKNGRYIVTVGKAKDEGSLKLDAAKKPKAMDIIGTDGPNKGKTFLAIYDVNGDSLKICYDLGGKARPEDFKTAQGTQQFLVAYKRATR